jgi:multidrug resistance efflux pump
LYDDNNGGTDAPGIAEERRSQPRSLSDRVQSLRLPQKQTGAARSGSWLPWLLCLGFAAASGVLAYMLYDRLQSDAGKDLAVSVKPNTNTEPAMPTTRAADVASSGEVVLERKGYVIPAHQILVSPKVSGMIEKLYIEEGMRVKKDQVLAELEDTEYRSDYDHARGNAHAAWNRFLELYTGNRAQEIKEAKADLEDMEAQRKQLYLDWKRSSRLQTGSALAAREFEVAESQYKAMERRVEKMRQAYSLMLEGARPERIEAAWGDIEQAEADLAKCKWKLDNCSVRAPVSGTILTKKAEIGNLVNPIAFNGSFSLCEMADLSDMEVDMSIEERDVARVHKGQRCKVRLEAFPDHPPYEGIVSRLMPTADRAKSAIPVRIKLTVPKNEEEGSFVKPDMGAIVSFLKKTNKDK